MWIMTITDMACVACVACVDDVDCVHGVRTPEAPGHPASPPSTPPVVLRPGEVEGGAAVVQQQPGHLGWDGRLGGAQPAKGAG